MLSRVSTDVQNVSFPLLVSANECSGEFKRPIYGDGGFICLNRYFGIRHASDVSNEFLGFGSVVCALGESFVGFLRNNLVGVKVCSELL